MDVLMPQLGETVAEGKITRWFKQAGDEVKPGDNLFEIETDKTSMEVPSTVAGKLTAINFKVGEVAKVGAVVAVIGGAGEVAPTKVAAQPAAPQPPLTPAKAGVLSQSAPKQAALDSRLRGNERIGAFAYPNIDPFREVRTPEKNYGPARVGGRQVTPLARRLAGERGIDLGDVKGSGPHGRIVAGDIEAAAPKSVATETRPSPHLYLVADVEIGRLLALCAEANAAAPKDKGGMPAFELSIDDVLIKAWAAALQRVPAANAVWADDGIRRVRSSDIALVLDDGPAMPVIHDAETKSLTAISAERRDLAARTRDNRLEPKDCQGGASAIANLGSYGVREFAAAINPPHATTLAVGAARRAPVEAEDGSVKFVSQMTVTLLCDTRVIGVATGGQLLAAFKALMENPVTALI
jgi:pyruvate dehydrogenase E2 component (dihydrolipoamide acetyltransferase)